VNDLLSTLSHTPLPTIFVVAGIMFWVLAIAGSLAGKIIVEPGNEKTAGLVGTAFIILGLMLLFFVPSPTNQSGPEATLKPPQTPVFPAPSQIAEPAPVQTIAPRPAEQTSARPSPGVNCTGTGTPDEVVICGSARLADLDWQLHNVYQALLKQLDPVRQKTLVNEENAWVKLRGGCKSDESCLTALYTSRISQLKSQR